MADILNVLMLSTIDITRVEKMTWHVIEWVDKQGRAQCKVSESDSEIERTEFAKSLDIPECDMVQYHILSMAGDTRENVKSHIEGGNSRLRAYTTKGLKKC